jgi:hypothetical protein
VNLLINLLVDSLCCNGWIYLAKEVISFVEGAFSPFIQYYRQFVERYVVLDLENGS